MERVRPRTKQSGNIYQYTHTNTSDWGFLLTQTDMIAGPFSPCLSSLLCLLAFLSLGLIRLLVEMKVIGEDSWASDESVCAVIALIKRPLLLAVKKKEKRLTMGLLFVPAASFW